MTDHPDAAELLRIARASLLEHILPGLSGEHRFTGLMIANAMAIAARELSGGDTPVREALERMRELIDDPAQPVASSALEAALREHDRRLAAAIREGRLDDSQALLDHLLKTAEAKLAVSNPKVLAPAGPLGGERLRGKPRFPSETSLPSTHPNPKGGAI